MFLNHRDGQQQKNDSKNNMLADRFDFFHRSEPEINEWIKSKSCYGTDAYQHQAKTKGTNNKVPSQRIIFNVYGILYLFTGWQQDKEGKENGEHKENQKFCIDGIGRTRYETKHLPDENKGLLNVCNPEEYPPDNHDKKGNEDGGEFANFFIDLKQDQSFKYQEQSMVSPPEDKAPGSPMP